MLASKTTEGSVSNSHQWNFHLVLQAGLSQLWFFATPQEWRLTLDCRLSSSVNCLPLTPDMVISHSSLLSEGFSSPSSLRSSLKALAVAISQSSRTSPWYSEYSLDDIFHSHFICKQLQNYTSICLLSLISLLSSFSCFHSITFQHIPILWLPREFPPIAIWTLNTELPQSLLLSCFMCICITCFICVYALPSKLNIKFLKNRKILSCLSIHALLPPFL